MKRVEIKALFAEPERYIAEPVTICGWVRTLRSSKALGFIELNDGSYFSNLQVVFEENKLANYDEISRQNVGAALIVTGRLLLTPEAKQPFEIHAEKITVEGASTPRLSPAEKAPQHGVPAHHPAPASPHQYLQRGV